MPSVNSLLHGLVIGDTSIPVVSLDLSPSGYCRWHVRAGWSVCRSGYRGEYRQGNGRSGGRRCASQNLWARELVWGLAYLLAEVTILALPSVHEARKLRESRVWVPVASE